ncbi:substrate-specific component CbiM of cobalt ECF transporter [Klebsiella pneumoniae subsp. pneumoniae]|uniref:Substrate-specific component CbiM of cobalt ECF transporter n=1 Tax=Klebsiella pneumoniae subsp. pneumoniae TaxID=72407 RepID=A0A377Z8G3_KLEPN|nr:substrate-specific component CbiM of cobalt ECF transporter [Klebsiella pneumoniae subsp. pneumoniae]
MNQVKSLKQLSYGGLAAAVLLIIVPQEAFAMHIMEGFLPPMWALAWWLLFYPACGTAWCACGVSSRKRAIRRCCWPSAGRLFLFFRR